MAYISAWVEYYRAHAREVLALTRIYDGFRDAAGRPNPAFDVRANEVAAVAQVLQLGQARGRLGIFDAQVMAAAMKAALDDLLVQFADHPDLDLEAYGAQLTALFDRATRAQPEPGHTATAQEER